VSVTPYGEPITGELETFQAGQVDLTRWAQDASEIHKIAQILASTNFVPTTMRHKPDEVCAQMLYGRDVNLPPMVALQQIHVIEGRPSLSALAMRGLAQAKAGVKFIVDENTSTRCVMRAKAPGDPGWTEVKWDIERAKKLGVAGKSNWTKQPQAMLIARATSELCRLVAAPLFLGLAYSTEELQDGAVDSPVDSPTPAPKTRTMKRAATPAPGQSTVDEVPLGSVSLGMNAPVKATATVPSFDNGEFHPPAPTLTDNTRAALMAQFRNNKITEGVTRAAYVSDQLNREVTSMNDLSEAEARLVIAQLKADAEETSG
jgi:hypothetical protein